MSDKPKLMKRRRIRKAEIAVVMDRMKILGFELSDVDMFNVSGMLNQIKEHGTCECGCGQSFNGMQLEWEHTIPNAMLYEGDPIDWRAYRKDCHLLKTKIDVKRIAKAKRQAGETGQYARRKRRDKPLIQGRGFQPAPAGHSAWGKPRAGNAGGFNRGYKSNIRVDD